MNYRLNWAYRLLWLCIVGQLLISGCSSPIRKPAVPEDLNLQAEVVGMPGVRYVVRDRMPLFIQDAKDSYYRERDYLIAQNKLQGELPTANFLAISGGGDNGAFTAGLLNGWTETGTRPEFKGVTGVSTGGLIAPFAFLGPKYDAVLRNVYTNTAPDDVFKPRNVLMAMFEDALADNAPLKRLIKKFVTQDLLREIAQEYRRGRLLFIATSDLDSTQAVIWNMGKIAASDHPDALALFHKIMLASAAIPGAFPPSMIDVEVNGKNYQEMHMDGGAMAQVFLYPLALKVGEISKQERIKRQRRLFLIRNARLDPDWAQVERRTLSIIARAISTLIQSQGRGDLYKIYALTERDGVDYNLAYIPKSFNAEHKEEFDTEYMRKLYQTGYDMAVKGYPWEKKPPGL